jgi:hypothetical protein
MGMSASQARMDLLVARKSDLEYQGQQINQRRLLLSYQSESVALTYNNALSAKKVYALTGDNSTQVEFKPDANGIVTTNTGTYRILVRSECSFNEKGETANVPSSAWLKGTSSDVVSQGLQNGAFFIQMKTAAGTWSDYKAGTTDRLDWRTQPGILEADNQDNREEATATYDAQSAMIQEQDKRLEIELKNVDTQHNAVQTEVDAVKKVITKNIEGSFKTFG